MPAPNVAPATVSPYRPSRPFAYFLTIVGSVMIGLSLGFLANGAWMILRHPNRDFLLPGALYFGFYAFVLTIGFFFVRIPHWLNVRRSNGAPYGIERRAHTRLRSSQA